MSKAAQGAAKSPTAGDRTPSGTRSGRSAGTDGASRTARRPSTGTGTAAADATDVKETKEAQETGEAENRTGNAGKKTAEATRKTAVTAKETAVRTGTKTTAAAPAKTRPRTQAPPGRTSAPASGARRRRPAWLRRLPRWWPLPLCLALGAAGGAVYAEVTPPQYAAISYVLVSPAGQSEAASALGYAQAYGKVATDRMVLAEAESAAHLRRGALSDSIQASTSPDAPMVQITASNARPKQAAKNADAVAEALADTARESVKRTGARLTVLSEAVAPAAPVSPSPAVALSVGACAGGLIGGLVLLTRPHMGRRQAAGSGPEAAGNSSTASDSRTERL